MQIRTKPKNNLKFIMGQQQQKSLVFGILEMGYLRKPIIFLLRIVCVYV